ncbi:MAG: methyltransferase domain-containing protein [Gammaproteobacteria bacterium]|nr:methyltransferase domain-containing protein [Gammaproteobacteria bacterium]
MSYDDNFVAALEWMWGEGFLSPGGPEEVREILKGVKLTGKKVLDIGCGIGGIDLLLVNKFGASHVVGIDIEPDLVDKAQQRVDNARLSDRIELRCVTPGALEFPNDTFDIVFTKDSLIHIENKQVMFNEIHRVLRSGGIFAASDWLGFDTPHTPEMVRWLELVGLEFNLCTASDMKHFLSNAGFEQISLRDRNEWYAEIVRDEIASVSGTKQAELAKRLGEESARHRLESSTAKLKVVEQGELRPTHLLGRKPQS